MSYRVVINSTGRAATLAQRTMPMLLAGGLRREDIEVWVSSEDELSEYELYVGGPLFIAPHDPTDKSLDQLGVAPVGLGLARNTVLRASTPGDHIVFIDDDVSAIVRALTPKATEEVTDLGPMFERMFRDAVDASATLWGVYPVANAYFMRPRIRYDLTYIIGALFGVVVTGRPSELVTLDDKEDYERSIRHYLADGVVVRNERFAPVTNYYGGAGGLQLSRTSERVRLAAEWLTVRYPDLCTLNLTKKSGWAEVRLKDRRPSPTSAARPGSASRVPGRR